MKHTPRLLFVAASILLTFACLGESETVNPIIPPSTTDIPAPMETASPNATPSIPKLGITVTYILDGNVWLWDESAPARQLTSDGEAWRVEFSDDGKVIVYQSQQTLWAVNTDGGSPHQLVNVVSYASSILPPRGVDLYLSQFEFQPETHWVYFNTEWSGDGFSLASNDLHRVNTDDSNPQALLTEGGGRFVFSPDGNLLTLSSLTDIKVIRADGSGLVTALSYPLASKQVDYKPKTVWMNDSSGFYTVLPSREKFRFLYVAADGSFSAQLAEFSAAWIDVSKPIISPDGTKVAYVVQTATSFDLHVVDAATADTIIASYEGAPYLELLGWSPDSRRVTFSNAHPVFLLTAGIGIPPSPLTESVSPYSLRWIDAEHFIFFREGQLLIGQAGSSEVIPIASGFQKQEEHFQSYDFIISQPP